jgi:hypothetical protein
VWTAPSWQGESFTSLPGCRRYSALRDRRHARHRPSRASAPTSKATQPIAFRASNGSFTPSTDAGRDAHDEDNLFGHRLNVWAWDRGRRRGHPPAAQQCRQRGHQGCRGMRAWMVARAQRSLSSHGKGARVPARLPPWPGRPAVLAQLTGIAPIGSVERVWRPGCEGPAVFFACPVITDPQEVRSERIEQPLDHRKLRITSSARASTESTREGLQVRRSSMVCVNVSRVPSPPAAPLGPSG